MAQVIDIAPANDRELALCRIVAAPREKVWRCWAEAELLKQWFCPRPWSVPHAEIDLRAGGISRATMAGPNGESHLHAGMFLEAIYPSRIVMTDAFSAPWQPSERAFIVATLTLDDHPEGTLYTVRVGHWSVEARKEHEDMGFMTGWGIAIDQMEAVAQAL